MNEYLSNLADYQAYLIMDLKMKFEAIYYREKNTELYGKKGQLWHGTMAYTRYIAA